MAQALRLFEEPVHERTQPPKDLEQEIRRRLWWSLFETDRHASHTSRLPLQIQSTDCKLGYPLSFLYPGEFDTVHRRRQQQQQQQQPISQSFHTASSLSLSLSSPPSSLVAAAASTTAFVHQPQHVFGSVSESALQSTAAPLTASWSTALHIASPNPSTSHVSSLGTSSTAFDPFSLFESPNPQPSLSSFGASLQPANSLRMDPASAGTLWSVASPPEPSSLHPVTSAAETVSRTVSLSVSRSSSKGMPSSLPSMPSESSSQLLSTIELPTPEPVPTSFSGLAYPPMNDLHPEQPSSDPSASIPKPLFPSIHDSQLHQSHLDMSLGHGPHLSPASTAFQPLTVASYASGAPANDINPYHKYIELVTLLGDVMQLRLSMGNNQTQCDREVEWYRLDEALTHWFLALPAWMQGISSSYSLDPHSTTQPHWFVAYCLATYHMTRLQLHLPVLLNALLQPDLSTVAQHPSYLIALHACVTMRQLLTVFQTHNPRFEHMHLMFRKTVLMCSCAVLLAMQVPCADTNLLMAMLDLFLWAQRRFSRAWPLGLIEVKAVMDILNQLRSLGPCQPDVLDKIRIWIE
ncbi:hypothetical protein BC831DRAFT_268485 [Entophlyctis helioformis]|nr:hypothetical protein BC831DRAFT_268485 [Entophlyctis helioformis]